MFNLLCTAGGSEGVGQIGGNGRQEPDNMAVAGGDGDLLIGARFCSRRACPGPVSAVPA